MFNRTRNSEIELLKAAAQQSSVYSKGSVAKYTQFRNALYIGHPNILNICKRHRLEPHVPLIGLGLPRKSGPPGIISTSFRQYFAFKSAQDLGLNVLSQLLTDYSKSTELWEFHIKNIDKYKGSNFETLSYNEIMMNLILIRYNNLARDRSTTDVKALETKPGSMMHIPFKCSHIKYKRKELLEELKTQNKESINDLVLIKTVTICNQKHEIPFTALDKSKNIINESINDFTKNLCYERQPIVYSETDKKIASAAKNSDSKNTIRLISKMYKKCLNSSMVMVRKIQKSPVKLMKFRKITALATWQQVLTRSKVFFIWEKPKPLNASVVKSKLSNYLPGYPFYKLSEEDTKIGETTNDDTNLKY